MNKKGFSTVLIILVLLIISITSYILFRGKTYTPFTEKVISRTPFSDGTITLEPDKYLILPSQGLIQFGRDKLPSSTPTYIFSDNKSQNTLNIVGLQGHTKVFDNGYIHEIENLGCELKTTFLDDYFATYVDNCTLDISTTPSENISIPALDNSYHLEINGAGTRTLSNFPLLSITYPRKVLRDSSFFNPGDEKNWTWEIYTAYGRTNINFTPEDVLKKLPKIRNIGSTKITIMPTGEYNSNHISNFTFSVKYSSQESKNNNALILENSIKQNNEANIN